MTSVVAVAPNFTATAPTASESACSVEPDDTANSSNGDQVAPSSAVYHTPPFAEPAYARCLPSLPAGPTAKVVVRPDTTGSPEACPWRIAEGPSGVQFTAPLGPGG